MPTKINLNGEIIELAKGESLQSLSENPNSTICYGCYSGRCGACKIEILENPENLNPRTDLEEFFFNDTEEPSTHRLACQCTPTGNIKVKTIKT